jgi:hypothetical protein
VAPVQVRLSPEAQAALNPLAGQWANPLDALARKEAEAEAQRRAAEEAAGASAEVGFLQRMRENMRNYWRTIAEHRPRQLEDKHPGAAAEGSAAAGFAAGEGVLADRSLGGYWRRQAAAQNLGQVQELRVSAPKAAGVDPLDPLMAWASPQATSKGGLMGGLADYLGLTALKQGVDESIAKVQGTLRVL